MLDLASDIDPLSQFKRHTPEFIKRLKAEGRPVVLTVNGKAELVVLDAASYPEAPRSRRAGRTHGRP